MKNLQTAKPVLCAGDVMPDLIVPYWGVKSYVRDTAAGLRPPAPDMEVKLCCGGTIGNAVWGLAKLGVPAMVLSKVGSDFQGRILREDLKDAGVDISLFFTDDFHPSMTTLVVTDETGDRFVFPWPRKGGAYTQIKPEELPPDLPGRIGWLHFCGLDLFENPTGETFAALAEQCAGAGVPVSIDLNLHTEAFPWGGEYEEKVRRIVNVSSVVFGSLVDEIALLSPDPRELVTQNRMVVAREGRQGCTLYTHEGVYSVGIYDLSVADTVGAGDCFNSGFIAAAVSGLPPEECLYWGNACGNWSVQFSGGHSCPDRGMLLQFLKENSIPKKHN